MGDVKEAGRYQSIYDLRRDGVRAGCCGRTGPYCRRSRALVDVKKRASFTGKTATL
ncbi:MAG: hypothetical protein O3B36_02665 [Proteobacteria bacterium]|nr:hypothetical protein [Pseudomonadota bacterium]